MKNPNALATVLAVSILALGVLACGQSAPEWQLRGWTITPSKIPNAQPSQTPFLVEITTTPDATSTPVLVPITVTPNVLQGEMCVTANENVYLRATPKEDVYPIHPIPNGAKVFLNGAKDGDWVFAIIGDQSGWINSNFLGKCK